MATLAVVFIALYIQRRHETSQRPRLEIAYREAKGKANGDNRYSPAGSRGCTDHEELWIRFRVKNRSKETAKDVEVRFISLKREGKGSESRPSLWLKVSNFNGVTIAVHSGFEQSFDLALVTNKVLDSADIGFFLAIVQPPLATWEEVKKRLQTDTDTRLQIGFKYDLSFAIVAANVGAQFYKVGLKAMPLGSEDSRVADCSGEAYLLGRIEVTPPVEVSSEEALSL